MVNDPDCATVGGADGADLADVLERSRALGLLGPGPVADHVSHAERLLALMDLIDDPSSTAGEGPRALDLGSGGGVPGLVLAAARSRWRWVLLDAQHKRTEVLEAAVVRLGLRPRVEVVRARAEDAARDDGLRGTVALVTARSFGPPAVTAECGAGFLSPGGRLAVSEPPDPDPGRWPSDGLAHLGLVAEDSPAPGWAVFRLTEAVADSIPRANGRPSKRPLW